MLDAGARYLRTVGPFYGMIALALLRVPGRGPIAVAADRQPHAPRDRGARRLAGAALERQPLARVPGAKPCAGRIRTDQCFRDRGRLVVRAAHLALERRGRPAKEIYLPLTRPDRAPPEGAEASEIDIRPMCAVRDSFAHWTAARRRIDYPIRECPVWRKATGGSGSRAACRCDYREIRTGSSASRNTVRVTPPKIHSLR